MNLAISSVFGLLISTYEVEMAEMLFPRIPRGELVGIGAGRLGFEKSPWS